jgi:hypothetical protein
VIKKAAGLLRDGIPSSVLKDRASARILFADARDVSGVATGTASLAFVCPEQPGVFEHGLRSWLRAWWLGLELPASRDSFMSVEAWQGYINEVLLETARLVKRGGRAVVRVGSGRIGSRTVSYREQIEGVLNAGFGEYWALEGTIVERYIKSSGLLKGAAQGVSDGAGEIVVLRRK